METLDKSSNLLARLRNVTLEDDLQFSDLWPKENSTPETRSESSFNSDKFSSFSSSWDDFRSSSSSGTFFDSENKWRYSEKFDSIVFLFDDKDAEAEIVKKVRSLPDDIRKDQMDDYLLNIANECNCPISIVVEETDSQYKQYGNVYSRRKYSLREMCSCVLNDFFPDGYHISSETDYRLFCSQLTTVFGYDSSQLSMQYLANIILELGFLCDKGTYKHFDYLNIDPELIQRIEKYIEFQFTKM